MSEIAPIPVKKQNNSLDVKELCSVAIHMINNKVDPETTDIDGIKVTVSNLRTARKFTDTLLQNFSKINLVKVAESFSVAQIDQLIADLTNVRAKIIEDESLRAMMLSRGIDLKKINEILKS